MTTNVSDAQNIAPGVPGRPLHDANGSEGNKPNALNSEQVMLLFVINDEGVMASNSIFML